MLLDLPIAHDIAGIDTSLPVVIDETKTIGQKIGAAIIVRSGKLAVIVTNIDICQAPSELLKAEFNCVAGVWRNVAKALSVFLWQLVAIVL